MGVGAFLEPLIVVTLLSTGTIVNRDKFFNLSAKPSKIDRRPRKRSDTLDDPESGRTSPAGNKPSGLSGGGAWSSTSTLNDYEDGSERWRRRTLHLWGWRKSISTPNTRVFEDRFLSRLLRRFPFLVEAWYWALIYWVYQIGRAITALTMVKDTVDVAREHALQLIHLEQALHLFVERSVQKWFLTHPTLMHWTNRLYSFVHIPGTITFLIVLYYITTTKVRGTSGYSTPSGRSSPDRSSSPSTRSSLERRRFGPHVYEARRRTMAMCNLLAFIVFTLWPCMPPRLLSDPNYDGENADEAKSFGFVDTVHGAEGESSVWTTNKFCNQYAAMPSLHFGYSFLIGLTIANLPIKGSRGLSLKRIGIIALGLTYPFMILAAIVSTANHFVLDAIAGACVCGLAWYGNEFLLNLLAVEDYFLWVVRIHKPVPSETIADESEWRYEPLESERP